MKIIQKSIAVMVMIATSLLGCKDDDKDIFATLELENSKAPFVRIVVENPVVARGDLATDAFVATVDDPSDNVSFWSLDVRRESGGVISDEAPLITVNSFPEKISIPFTDIASALGIGVDEIQGGDFLRFLGTATGSDGSVVTEANFSANVTGQPEQRQAFNFIVLVNCSPISDATIGGTWVIEMTDLFGDGWDGAFVTFSVDGVETNYTFSAGSNATFNIDVPADTSELVISYTSGSFEEEHVYTIQTPDGDIRGPFGPNPAPCIN
ncbi:MAG: hypothetical protein AB3N18_12260 [Allomuricauda sp.]